MFAVLDALAEASNCGAKFPELMELLDRYKRLWTELTTLEYELTSPFARPASETPRIRRDFVGGPD